MKSLQKLWIIISRFWEHSLPQEKIRGSALILHRGYCCATLCPRAVTASAKAPVRSFSQFAVFQTFWPFNVRQQAEEHALMKMWMTACSHRQVTTNHLFLQCQTYLEYAQCKTLRSKTYASSSATSKIPEQQQQTTVHLKTNTNKCVTPNK